MLKYNSPPILESYKIPFVSEYKYKLYCYLLNLFYFQEKNAFIKQNTICKY